MSADEAASVASGPLCRTCDRRALWREGMGWLHAQDDTSPLVIWPHLDDSGHEVSGYWPEPAKASEVRETTQAKDGA